MNLSAQEPNVFWKKVSIPKGLPALLETLVKETIRENPDDIVTFLSNLVDNLIVKRDQEEGTSDKEASGGSGKGNKRKSEEENPLLEHSDQHLLNKYTKSNEEEAASKIQAGFRGYQTRKSLKSNDKKKGGELSLTSLTPDNQVIHGDSIVDEERKRVEKFADEAIAAEIKTPLETIREESVDGRLLSKTPDIHHANPDYLENETSQERPSTSHNASLKLAIGTYNSTDEDITIEEAGIEEGFAIRNKNDNYITQAQLAKNVTNETVEDGVDPIIISNVNEVLHAQGFPVEVEDEPKSEQSNGSDEGTSVEIKESEVETLVELTDLDIHGKNEDLHEESETGNDIVTNEGKTPETDAVVVTDPIVLEKIKNLSTELEEIDNQVIPDLKSSSIDVDENESVFVEAVISTDANEHISEAVIQKDNIDSEIQFGKELLEKLENVPILIEDSSTSLPNEELTDSDLHNQSSFATVEVNEEISKKDITTAEANAEILEDSKLDEVPANPPENNAEKSNQSKSVSCGLEVGQLGENAISVEDISANDIKPIIKNEVIAVDSEKHLMTTAPLDEIPLDSEPKLLTKSDSLMDGVDELEFIGEEKSVPSPNDEQTVDVVDDTSSETSNNNMSPTLTKCEQPSFANTDSVSSPVTVRAADFDKRQDSSQDISSRSETPVPKPRKPVSGDEISLDEIEVSKRQRLEESKDAVDELKDEVEPAPVMRRQKSTHKNKAISSKYRSGFVMDESLSMDEMEAQIENEMMSHAATKIQAGFRGYKTRKNIRSSGVRFDDNAGEFPVNSVDEPIDNTISTAESSTTAASASAYEPQARAASVSGSAPSASALGRGSRPPLTFLRSRSFPGSHEDDVQRESDEHDVELEYDPAYVNNAATKIQASVRGYLVRRSFKHKKGVQSNEIKEPAEVEKVDLIISPADRDGASPMSDDLESEQAASKIQAAFRGYSDRKKVRQTKKAVVTIQATVRGFLTRRRLAKLRRYINSPTKRRSMQRRRSSAKMVSHEVQRVVKAHEAATKIQAVYRGYQVRSKIRKDLNDE